MREIAEVVRASLRTVVPRLVLALAVMAVGDLLSAGWYDHEAGRFGSSVRVGEFVQIAGIAMLALVQASAFRHYARLRGRLVAEPPPTTLEVLGAAIWTNWPLIVASVLIFGALATAHVPLSAPPAGLALAVLTSALVAAQGWAFAYATVDGAGANSSIGAILRALRAGAVFYRACGVGLTSVAVAWLPSLLYALSVPRNTVTTVVLGVVPAAIFYPFYWAALLETRPAVPELLAVPLATPTPPLPAAST